MEFSKELLNAVEAFEYCFHSSVVGAASYMGVVGSGRYEELGSYSCFVFEA